MMERGIYSRGRFGAWRYEIGNMDHSVMMGVEAVNHILAGEKETVLYSSITEPTMRPQSSNPAPRVSIIMPFVQHRDFNRGVAGLGLSTDPFRTLKSFW